VEFIDLARRLSQDELARVVAPTPAWTVHDVLAHVLPAADLEA
jgi:hypothetical protein